MSITKEESLELEKKKKLLELREELKHKRPKFVRQESWRYKRIKENWRRPRGLDSKMRRKIKGWPKTPEIGYRGPKKVRGLHPSGLKEVLVYNPEQLDEINPETQAIRIAHTVGARKRMEIVAKAVSKNIRILNPKEVEFKPVEEEKEKEKIEEIEEEELKEQVEEKEEEKPEKKRKRTTKKKRTRKTTKTKRKKKSEEK